MSNVLTNNFIELLGVFTSENFPEFLWDNSKKKVPLKNNLSESIIIDDYSGKTPEYIMDSIQNIFLFWLNNKNRNDSITFYFFTADDIYFSYPKIFPEFKWVYDEDQTLETIINSKIYKFGSMKPVLIEPSEFTKVLVTFTKRITDAKNILSKIRIDKSFDEKQSNLTKGVNLNEIA